MSNRSCRGFEIVKASIAGILLAVASFGAAGAACTVETPAEVLGCLEDTYATHDLQEYEALLADDFVHYFGPDSSASDRRQEIEAARRMMEIPGSVIEVHFDKDCEVTPGKVAGSWVLDGVSGWIRVEIPREGGNREYRSSYAGLRFLIRTVDAPSRRFEIAGMWDPGPER